MKLLRDPYIVIVAAVILVLVPLCMLVISELSNPTTSAIVSNLVR